MGAIEDYNKILEFLKTGFPKDPALLNKIASTKANIKNEITSSEKNVTSINTQHQQKLTAQQINELNVRAQMKNRQNDIKKAMDTLVNKTSNSTGLEYKMNQVETNFNNSKKHISNLDIEMNYISDYDHMDKLKNNAESAKINFNELKTKMNDEFKDVYNAFGTDWKNKNDNFVNYVPPKTNK